VTRKLSGNLQACQHLLETESQQIFEKNWGFNKGYQDIYFNNDFISKSVTAPKVWDIGAGKYGF
jgi:hypothetical protein